MIATHILLTCPDAACGYDSRHVWDGATPDQLTSMAHLINGVPFDGASPMYLALVHARPHKCPRCTQPLSAAVVNFTP